MSFELNIPKKWHWIIIWIEFYLEMNKWITVWVDCLLVWWKSLFMSILDTFGQFSALFLICQYQEFPVYWIELPLNWISRFFRNQIIFWIELNNIESNIEWIIFWQYSNIKFNQIGYRTPLRWPANVSGLSLCKDMKLTTQNSGVSVSALIGKANSNRETIKSVEIVPNKGMANIHPSMWRIWI